MHYFPSLFYTGYRLAIIGMFTDLPRFLPITAESKPGTVCLSQMRSEFEEYNLCLREPISLQKIENVAKEEKANILIRLLESYLS
jgi:hypothetical protein